MTTANNTALNDTALCKSSDASNRTTHRTASTSFSDDAASAPWQEPDVVVNTREPVFFRRLKNRLAAIPIQSKHRNQSLFIDLRTGQHWLQLKVSRPEFTLYMLPVSIDTALSIAQESDYRRWNPSLFPQYDMPMHNTRSATAITA